VVRCKLLWGQVNPLHVVDISQYEDGSSAYSKGKRTKIQLIDGRSWSSISPIETVQRQVEEALSSCVHQVIERTVEVEIEVPVVKIVEVNREFMPVMADLSLVLAWIEQTKRPYMRQDEKDALARVIHQLATRPDQQGEK
jgi:hypothetical protein